MTSLHLPDGSIVLDGVRYSVVNRMITVDGNISGKIAGYPLDALGWAARCDAERKKRGLPAWAPPKPKPVSENEENGTRYVDRQADMVDPFKQIEQENSLAAFRTPHTGSDSSAGSLVVANEGSIPSGRAGVRATSIEAYHRLGANGKMSVQQTRIVEHFLATRPSLSRQEIARDVGLPINVVCGRVYELIRATVLVENGRKVCSIMKNEVNAIELREVA